MSLPEEKSNGNSEKSINLGSDITARVTGAALALSIGGSDGAFTGAAVVPIIALLLKEMGTTATSFISRRAKARVEKALKKSAFDIQHRLEKGEKIQLDNFNNSLEDFQDFVEKIIRFIEQDTHRKKAILYSSLLTNILFQESTNFDEILFLTDLLNKLSFLQLKIIKFIVESEDDYLEIDNINVYELFQKSHIISSNSKYINLKTEVNQLNGMIAVFENVEPLPHIQSSSDISFLYIKKIHKLFALDSIEEELKEEFFEKLDEVFEE